MKHRRFKSSLLSWLRFTSSSTVHAMSRSISRTATTESVSSSHLSTTPTPSASFSRTRGPARFLAIAGMAPKKLQISYMLNEDSPPAPAPAASSFRPPPNNDPQGALARRASTHRPPPPSGSSSASASSLRHSDPERKHQCKLCPSAFKVKGVSVLAAAYSLLDSRPVGV